MPAPKFNLATDAHEHDATNAKLLRTYRSVDYPGLLFLQRKDIERGAQAAKATVVTRLPPRCRVIACDLVQGPPIEQLYGTRGKHPDVHYAMPFAFVQLVGNVPSKPPAAAEVEHEGAGMTRFTDAGMLFFEEHTHQART